MSANEKQAAAPAPSLAKSPSSNNTQIILALIGFATAVSGGLFAHWDKIFPPQATEPAAVEEVTETPEAAEAGEDEAVVTAAEDSLLNLKGIWKSPNQNYSLLEFEQDGDWVSATYRYNNEYGYLTGSVTTDRQLHCQWWEAPVRNATYEEAPTGGDCSFQISAAGDSMVGVWQVAGYEPTEWSFVRQN